MTNSNSAFINYEMKNGKEKLMEALHLRGFFVKEENDYISLVNGSKQDIIELKLLLKKCSIPVLWNGNQFQLLVNNLPAEKAREIICYKGKNHYFGVQDYHLKWRSFVNRRYGIRISTLDNCPFTAIMAKALNFAGIVTLCCCNGHGKHAPNFRLSGIYNGIWFKIIQEKYLADLTLHYRWEIDFEKEIKIPYIVAKKRTDETWDMLKVLADCEKMANVLLQHADEIRSLKRNIFKRNMKEEAESMKDAGDIKGLYSWMKNKIEQYFANMEMEPYTF